ncbi:FAD dependent oxidoreductase [Cynara cardunculus var. scolymus]|uniref:FAD dependent oxidoreductase n=1 Tax=Cynara cardunculus var. scolymus TaxID=59895 RepID=A0A124SFB3_CYNCS|nr:FAD dependent oxidoreductase [Cynara cardunculus var. scolymus]
MMMKSPIIIPSRRPPSSLTVRASMDNNPQQIDPPKKKVVVCGGGVIGVCTAYFLSKKGAAVTLIEQSSIACAASGKAGGFLALDWCDGSPVSSLARASFGLHRSLAEELNGRELYGYRPVNALSLSIAESENPPRSRKSKLPPWIDGPAKTPKTIGTTETTAQVHPQLFTRTLMEKAVAEYGAEVVIGKLLSVETGGGKISAVVEGGGVIDGDAVVLALGPWSSKLTLLSSIIRVNGLKAHSLVLEPKEMDAITAHALFLSYQPAHGGQPMDPEIYPRPTGVEARVKAEQACFLPCTDDSIPVIGEIPGMAGCFVATGHSCWGILNGPATGAAMAELVMDGGSSIVDLTRFSPARFV